MKRKICVITGSRADYGHLVRLMKEIHEDPKLELQLVVTGMHLSKEHGMMVKTIQKNGLPVAKRLEIMDPSNSELGVSRSMGKALMLFAQAFDGMKTDLVVLLGDRFEMMAAGLAAYVAKIPIAHIHGGELTQGVLDEGFRHGLTKLASVHFPATNDYKRRIIQMGEDPQRVFNFGAPGLEGLCRIDILSKEALAKGLGLDPKAKTAIVTYHPETLGKQNPRAQIDQVLRAIKKSGIKAIFTAANNDPQGRLINDRLKQFCRNNSKDYKFFEFLGQSLYFSCLKHCDLMIGNSSSGLIEAPSFRLPVVNIGERQSGRVRSKNVIDVATSQKAIEAGIKKAMSAGFRRSLKSMKNPYEGPVSRRTNYRIKEKLKSLPLGDALLKKEFYDIKFSIK